jgi:hypothetical protein
VSASYDRDERVAIAIEAGVSLERAEAIAECEAATRAGLVEACECGAHGARMEAGE